MFFSHSNLLTLEAKIDENSMCQTGLLLISFPLTLIKLLLQFFTQPKRPSTILLEYI